jgi:hypothetical protein
MGRFSAPLAPGHPRTQHSRHPSDVLTINGLCWAIAWVLMVDTKSRACSLSLASVSLLTMLGLIKTLGWLYAAFLFVTAYFAITRRRPKGKLRVLISGLRTFPF